MSTDHSAQRPRAVDRTTTDVTGGLGKLNLPQRGETTLGAAGAVGAAFSDAASHAAQAGRHAVSGVLAADQAVAHGTQAVKSAGAVVARPLAAHLRMGADVITTLKAGENDDATMVKKATIGNPERLITNRFLPASMRQNPMGTAPRLVKHTLEAPKRAITSYRDAKAALTRGKDAAKAAGASVKNTAKAGQNLARGARAVGSGTGQATRAAVHASKPAVRATGRALRGAGAMAVRGAQAAAAAIRAAITGLVAVFSSTSPLVIAIVAIISVMVLIFTWFGWLLPSLIEKGEDPAPPGEYGVAPPGPWGGYDNGKIPEDELAEIPFAPGYYLRSDAAAQLSKMNEAYRAEFGVGIIVSDAYRDYDAQVEAREMWCARGSCGNAAPPGTSNHGWALAVDLGGGINSWTSPEHDWMVANAADFGYYNPEWAAPGALNEPWHWDFWGVEDDGTGGSHGADGDAQEYARKRVVDDLYYGITTPEFGGEFHTAEEQWVCLKQLWTGESNWNYQATNPESGAYGIPQAWPGDKMAAFGDDWKTNPKTQIEWGLDYIKSAYQTPCQAWDFWNSQDPHWY